MKKAFVTIFPPFKKMHALKDVGIIPKMMADYFGYKLFIFSNDNSMLVSTGRVYEYNNFERIEVVKKQIFGRLQLKDIFIHNQIGIGL